VIANGVFAEDHQQIEAGCNSINVIAIAYRACRSNGTHLLPLMHVIAIATCYPHFVMIKAMG